ncbi:hypothetical protein Tco_1151192 [Tanacetum coccineum]
MLTKEMKLTKHYQLHASVFGVDVLMTQSQPIESTRGAHRTPSIPRPPNPIANQGESKIDIASLDEATQMSIAIERSLVDLKAQQNVKRVEEHLVDAKIKQIIEGNDDERPEVKKSDDLMIIDEEEEEESAGDALIRRKGKDLQELTASDPTPSSSKQTNLSSKPKPNHVKQYKSLFHKMSRRYGYMFRHLKQSFMPGKNFKAITDAVLTTLKKVAPKMVDHSRNNALIETNGEDAVEHIENFLKIVDPLVLPNVSYERLRLVVFPISLTGKASKWLKEERQCLITTWGDLTMRLFGKYYLPSCTGKMTETKAKWDPIDVKRGDDEIALTNGKVFDVEEEYSNEDGEIAKIFRIETNIFNYKTPMCKAFNEFNYLFQINPDVLTKDIVGFKTYEEYKDDWIYEWKKDVPWNGQLAAGKMTDISMEETYLDHLELVTRSIIKMMNHMMKFGKGGTTMRIPHNNAEGNNDDADGIGNLDNDLAVDNASYHANEEEEHYEEDRSLYGSCWNTDAFTTHDLAHKRNMEDHTEQIPGEFLLLIL